MGASMSAENKENIKGYQHYAKWELQDVAVRA